MTTISEGPPSVADAVARLDIRAQAFIDGAYVDAASGERFECVSPITGEVVATVAAGDVVVQGDLIGVAKRPIAANDLGSLALTGVFDIAKIAATALAVGAVVYWDATAKVATNTANAGANKLLGKVVKAALAADVTVRVRLSQ